MSALAAIIDRCTAASEGSQLLDKLIADELGIRFDADVIGLPAGAMPERVRYTRLFEAAISLIPEQHDLQLEQYYGEGWQATLFQHGAANTIHSGKPTTPALAITIAALKARQVGKA